MKTEKTLAFIFLIGLLLKLFNIPGAVFLMFITSFITSMLYFPMAFYFFSDKTLKTQNIALSIVGGMVLALIPIGILFKIMFWPGASIMLLAGIPMVLVTLVLTFFLYKNTAPELHTYYKNYLIRIIFWLVMATVFWFTSKRQLLRIQHSNNPELFNLKINAYENPDNIEYRNALDNYYKRQDSLYMVNKRDELLTQ